MINKEDFIGVNEKLDELTTQRRFEGYETNDDILPESEKEKIKENIKSIEKELIDWKKEWKENTFLNENSKVYIDEECLKAQDDLNRHEKDLEFKLIVIDRFNEANPNSKVPKHLREYPENYKYKKKWSPSETSLTGPKVSLAGFKK